MQEYLNYSEYCIKEPEVFYMSNKSYWALIYTHAMVAIIHFIYKVKKYYKVLYMKQFQYFQTNMSAKFVTDRDEVPV